MAKDGHELYFITEYPSGIKPFYVMPKAQEPEYSYSFDLEYKGDEMASGGQREHRYDHLVAKIKEKGLNPENLDRKSTRLNSSHRCISYAVFCLKKKKKKKNRKKEERTKHTL